MDIRVAPQAKTLAAAYEIDPCQTRWRSSKKRPKPAKTTFPPIVIRQKPLTFASSKQG